MDSLYEVEALNVSVSRRSWRTCCFPILQTYAKHRVVQPPNGQDKYRGHSGSLIENHKAASLWNFGSAPTNFRDEIGSWRFIDCLHRVDAALPPSSFNCLELKNSWWCQFNFDDTSMKHKKHSLPVFGPWLATNSWLMTHHFPFLGFKSLLPIESAQLENPFDLEQHHQILPSLHQTFVITLNPIFSIPRSDTATVPTGITFQHNSGDRLKT